jgi:8-oxo-dGTP pyrophosphatase MutT (NUDIX family)
VTSNPRHSVSVAAVVIRTDGHVLLTQRRDNGHWEPPGGVLELHEMITDGLVREVREETGLTVEVDALTGVYQNLPLGIVALVFRARPTDGELATSDETAAFRWVTTDELKSLMQPVYAIRVRDALAYDGHPAVRAHDGERVLAT